MDEATIDLIAKLVQCAMRDVAQSPRGSRAMGRREPTAQRIGFAAPAGVAAEPATSSAGQDIERAIVRLSESKDLEAAAECLLAIGRHVGMTIPGVIDDYSSKRLLTTEDGRALASVLGWKPHFFEQYLKQKLYLASPIAAACRISTKPFAWDALVVEKAFREARRDTDFEWPLTPARGGIFGGITIPIHLPRGRTGSVSWYSRDPGIDIPGVLHQFGGLLRLAAHRFMDLVYLIRTEAEDARFQLSERELECLTWAALGRTDSDIGNLIHRSPATARFHIDNAVRKLGARNRTQAVAIAAQQGLIHPLDGALIHG